MAKERHQSPPSVPTPRPQSPPIEKGYNGMPIYQNPPPPPPPPAPKKE